MCRSVATITEIFRLRGPMGTRFGWSLRRGCLWVSSLGLSPVSPVFGEFLHLTDFFHFYFEQSFPIILFFFCSDRNAREESSRPRRPRFEEEEENLEDEFDAFDARRARRHAVEEPSEDKDDEPIDVPPAPSLGNFSFYFCQFLCFHFKFLVKERERKKCSSIF